MVKEIKWPQGYVLQGIDDEVDQPTRSLYRQYQLGEFTQEEYEAEQFKIINKAILALYLMWVGIESVSKISPEEIKEARDNISFVIKEGEPLYREIAPTAPEQAYKSLNRSTAIYIGLINHQDPTGEIFKYLQENPQFSNMVGGIPEWLKNKGGAVHEC